MRHYDEKEKRTFAFYVFIFLFLAAGIIASGYYSYRNYEREFRHQAEHQISAIAELKVNGLVNWRKERLGDAEFIFRNSVFRALVERYFENPDDIGVRVQLFAWLGQYQAHDQYDRVHLLDTRGQTRLSYPAGIPPISSGVAKRIPEVLQTKQTMLVDFYQRDIDQQIRLCLLIPIMNAQADDQVIGLMTVSIDPQVYFYPSIQTWPINSNSAETLLVRRDGENVLFLNQLRFEKNAALNLHYPLTNTDIPAVKAVLGQTGVVEGMDYRGEQVMADVRAVPDSPWFLISKMDIAEVYAPLRARLWQTLLIASMAIFLAGAGMVLVWRQQRILFYREQVDAVVALRENEEKYRQLVDTTGTGYVIIDEQGRVTDANQEYVRLTGRPRLKDVIGHKVLEWTAPHDLERNAKEVRKCIEQGFVRNLEIDYITPSNKIIPVEINATVLRVSGSLRVLTLCRDITGRRQAEEALNVEQYLMQTLMNNVPVQIYFKDSKSRFIRVNTTQSKLFGLSDPERAVGKTDFDFFSDEHAQQAYEDEQEIIRTGQPISREERETWDGFPDTWVSTTKLPLRDKDGKVIGTFGISTDITERKQADEVLRESEEKYRRLFDNATLGIFQSTPEGKALSVNYAFARMFGYDSPEDAITNINNVAADIFADSNRRAEIIRSIEENPDLRTFENVYRRKDGSTFIGSLNSMPISDSKGRLIRLEGIIEDITGRKQAEELLRESEERYRLLFETAPVGIILANPQGQILEVNPTAVQILGSPSSEATKSFNLLTFQLLIKAGISSDFQKCLDTAKSILVEYPYTTAWGKSIQLFIRFTPVSNKEHGQIELIQLILEDVTERRRAEEALRAAEEKYRNIFENAMEAITQTSPEGKFITANPSAARMEGFDSPEELIASLSDIGRQFYVKPGRREEFKKLMEEFGTINGFESEVYRKDGSKIWVVENSRAVRDERGNLLYYEGTSQDITERKQAEEALRENQQLLQAVMDNIPQCIFWKDSKLTYLGCNRAFAESVGLTSPGDIVGKTDWDLPSEYAELYRVDDRRVMENGIPKLNYEEPQTSLDGATNWLRTSKIPMRDANGNVYAVLGMYENITERKQAEKALQENEEILRLAVSAGRMGVWNRNFLSGQLDWSIECKAMFGLAPEVEMNDERFMQALHPEDRTPTDLAIREALEKQTNFDAEYRVIWPDGTIHWIATQGRGHYNEAGQVIHMVGITIDITERKQTESALKLRETYLTAIIENQPGLIWLKDIEGRFLVANSAFAFSCGQQTPEEVSGKTDLDIWPRGLAEKYRADDDEVIKQKKPLQVEEAIFDQGQTKWFETFKMPVFDETKQVIGTTGFAHDITGRKQAEEEIRQLNTGLEKRVRERTVQLETTNKELEAFSYSVSHDLRAPLRGIDGWSQALFEDYHDKLDEQGQKYIERVRSESQRMGHLIDDLLRLSRLTRVEMIREHVDLSAIAQTVVERLKQDEPHRRVDFKLQKELGAEGDPHLLESVLTNLLGNAFKFTAKRADAQIEFGQTEIQDQRVFFVRDNGAGFDMAYAKNLFGAFQRMHKDSEFPGTGIGLATVQRIVHRHGGRVWAEAEVGRGATIYFTLEEKA
jgi:PAS domain S-box-containing protein